MFAIRIIKDDQIVYSSNDSGIDLTTFLQRYYEHTGYMITIPFEKQHLAKLLTDMSGMFVHHDVYESLLKFDHHTSSGALSGPLSEKFLEDSGFVNISPEEQFVFDPFHFKLYRKPGFSYDVKVGPYSSVLIAQKHKEYFLFDQGRESAKNIRRVWHQMTKTNPDDTFPEPVDINLPTPQELENITQAILSITGFTGEYYSGSDQKHDIYSTTDFIKDWEEETGENFYNENLAILSKYDIEYDEFREHLIAFQRSFDELQVELDAAAAHDKCSIAREFSLLEYRNPLNVHAHSPHKFADSLKDWNFFKELYRAVIVMGDLKKEFSQYKAFYRSMYSCNRFFFPAMNGEQCGNDDASKALFEVSLSIVNRRKSERDEE